jgi:hypothetical protein
MISYLWAALRLILLLFRQNRREETPQEEFIVKINFVHSFKNNWIALRL